MESGTISNSSIQLRFATEADTALILTLIKELASYERLLHEVVADEEALRKTLFGQRKVAEVIIASYEGIPAGYALFFHSYSTFLGRPGIYLEDLFVREALRGKGIGTAMLAFLAQVAVDRNCGRLEWSVLDWNTPSIGFYEALGAKPMDEWTVFRLDGNALQNLADTVEPEG